MARHRPSRSLPCRSRGRSGPYDPLCSPSSRLDLDFLRSLLRFRGLRQRHLEDTVLERALDLVGIDAFGHAEIALERAITAFGDVVVLLLFFRIFLLFGLDRDPAAGDIHFYVLLVNPGQLGRDLIGLVCFGDVDGRSVDEFLRPSSLKSGERAERTPPEIITEIVEKAIDFLPQCLERTPDFSRERRRSLLLRNG